MTDVDAKIEVDANTSAEAVVEPMESKVTPTVAAEPSDEPMPNTSLTEESSATEESKTTNGTDEQMGEEGGAPNAVSAEEEGKEEAKEEPKEETMIDDTLTPLEQKYVTNGMEKIVAKALADMINNTDIGETELDDRAEEMIRQLRPDQAVYICEQMKSVNLTGVGQKAIYLSAMIRNFKDRARQLGFEAAMRQPLVLSPDKDKLKELLDRTGYTMEVTVGQRKYGGPPPGWTEEDKKPSCECYVGHLPKNVFEDEVVPLFEECGRIYDVRIMMDALTGASRGYAFVTFVDGAAAKIASDKLNGHMINSRPIVVNVSKAQTRIFIGNMPKTKGKDEILSEMQSAGIGEGINEIIIYASTEDPLRRPNRGFCFVEYDEHKNASDAKRKLTQGRVRLWNAERLVVDWAETPEEPDADYLNTVKVIYARNLKESVTEQNLKEEFEKFGTVERVQKIKDFAFIHFTEREEAVKAMEAMKEHEFDGQKPTLDWARPRSNKPKPARDHFGGGPGGRGGRGGGFRGGGGGWGGRGGGGGWGGRGGGGGWGGAPAYHGGYGADPSQYWGEQGYGGGGYGGGQYAGYGYDAWAGYGGGGGYEGYGGGGYGDYYGGGGGGGYGADMYAGYAGYGGGYPAQPGGYAGYGGQGYAPRGGGRGRGRGGGGPMGKRPNDGSGGDGGAKRSAADFSSDVNAQSFS